MPSPIRIASFAMQAKGGAGLSSHKLHKQFLRDGHESRLLVAKQTWNTDQVELLPNDPTHRQDWWTLGTVPVAPGVQNIVSSGLAGKSMPAIDAVHEWADVVLLRWVTATISDYQIARWCRGDTPVVWCLSDMAPLTGGCHYAGDCHQYETDCAECPTVDPAYVHVPRAVISRRRRLWQGLTIVSPSQWLADCSRQSAALRNHRVEVIPTGVELDLFFPESRDAAIQRVGLDPRRSTILFGADSVAETRKGVALLVEALKHLMGHAADRQRFQLLVVGASTPALDEALTSVGAPYAATGHLTDRAAVRAAYAAADVVALPYLQDNLPNVMLEALACGVPVAAFATGGMKDVLADGVNGALAIPFDTHDFAHAIRRVLATRLSREHVRDWACKHLDIRDQARRYIQLFEELRSRVPTAGDEGRSATASH